MWQCVYFYYGQYENKDYDDDNYENYLEYIKTVCKNNNVNCIHDFYNTDFDIFIGIKKHQVINGAMTYTSTNGWISDKDKFTKDKKFTTDLEVNEEDITNVNNVYKILSKFKEYPPRWLLFTYKS